MFEQIVTWLIQVRVDGEIRDVITMKLDRYKMHFIELVVDKYLVDGHDEKRLQQSINLAMQHGKGVLMIVPHCEYTPTYFSRKLMCPTSGISYNEPAPHTFSFNSPQGACPRCKGIGVLNEVDIDKIAADQNENIYNGGLLPVGKYKNTLIFAQLDAIADKYGFTLKTPIKDIPEEGLDVILNGTT